nr:hypothetical protein [Tanacetum cinerariifolium]
MICMFEEMAYASLGSSSSSNLDSEKLDKAEKQRDELKLTLEKFQNSSKSLNNLLESQNQVNVKSRSDKGFHALHPPYTGNYIRPKPDLMFIDEQVESEYVDVVSNVASSDAKTVVSKHRVYIIDSKFHSFGFIQGYKTLHQAKELKIYSLGSTSVEERQVYYKKNEAVFEEKVNILILEVRRRDNAIVEYTKKLEKPEKERDELKLTLEKFQNSSKS